MIQNIAPHVYDNSFLHRREPQPGDRVFFVRAGKEVYLKKSGDGQLELPRVDEVGEQRLRFGFLIDDVAFFVGQTVPELPGYEFVNQAAFRTLKPDWLAFAGITGMQLWRFFEDHKFCSACGTPLEDSPVERAFICPKCGAIRYPRLNPAVIVAVTNGDRLLVSRYANRTLANYALLAGYAEIGEPLEDTVHREVLEEVGLRVKNLRFYKSQPWSFTDTLLSGFYCEVDGDDTITLDREELKEGVWLTREELPTRRGEASLTAEMIQRFKDGKEFDF